MLLYKTSLAVIIGFALTALPAQAQTSGELVHLFQNLKDMCRDGAGNKTGEACESQEMLFRLLKQRNICIGELGKVQPCKAGTSENKENDNNGYFDVDKANTRCERFAEDDLIKIKGFIVEFDDEAEESQPMKVVAVVPDRPLCWDKDPKTEIDLLGLNIKSTKLLGRHAQLEVRMVAGDSWMGQLRKIEEDRQFAR